MKNRIKAVIVLMAICVAGISGLQLFWNYNLYTRSVTNFKHDINESLELAVQQEMDIRTQKIIDQFKVWMSDTSLVLVTCHITGEETVFDFKDAHHAKSNGASMSIEIFKEKIGSITPTAKSVFINHFADKILARDLKKGIVYYYTQQLGDSLNRILNALKLDTTALRKGYTQILGERGIHTDFIINPKQNQHPSFVTRAVNTALRRPYIIENIAAGFESPDLYFLDTMKWLIISSLALIGITVFCFAYTAQTLLSQQKLSIMKNDFINNMTHEINTPLSSIAITAEALQKFGNDTARQQEYLEIIRYQSDKLTTLTARLLETAKLDGLQQINAEKINLSDILKQAVSDVEPQRRQRDGVIVIDAPSDLHILGDSHALINAFTNIIDNALKYGEDHPKLKIGARAEKQVVLISFEDNGPGITSEYRDKIFDRFFRIPTGNNHDVKGYGLGLNYVREIVRLHKGAVWVTENPHGGSIFTIKIPLAE